MTQAVDWPGLGDEELLIAVANTAHGESDELADAGSVRAWWRGIGARVPAPVPHGRLRHAGHGAPTRRGRSEAAEAVATLRGLRGVIRALALRNNGIDADVSDIDLALRLDLRGTPTLRADVPGDLARDLAAATVTALLRAMARPGWPRFKACRGDDCRWVFIDGSRNTSRRWCDMANCGNRAKMATFRERHRNV